MTGPAISRTQGTGEPRIHRDVDGRLHIKILPREHQVTGQPVLITTVLGSCIAICLRDAGRGIAGMNHFMLPGCGDTACSTPDLAFAEPATDELIRTMIACGARRRYLSAKVFGGAHVLAGRRLPCIGDRNTASVIAQLEHLCIPIIAQDTGGALARVIHYDTVTGNVRVRRLPPARAHDTPAASVRTMRVATQEHRPIDVGHDYSASHGVPAQNQEPDAPYRRYTTKHARGMS